MLHDQLRAGDRIYNPVDGPGTLVRRLDRDHICVVDFDNEPGRSLITSALLRPTVTTEIIHALRSKAR